MKSPYIFLERPWFVVVALAGLIGGGFLISTWIRTSDGFLLCPLVSAKGRVSENYDTKPLQLKAILHYATSTIVPQQSISEISITLDVLKSVGRPCNFLVFGLGHDSLMWASFNSGGTTIFLEEDPKWVQNVLKDAPNLHAHTVQYRTQLQQADDLLSSYLSEPNCLPSNAYLRGNRQCKLALENLPEEVYDKEWDLIMIDAPRGYFPEAPGRMAAIFSAAVMSRNRKGSGGTHVFLHDVDRKVEKVFAEEFLCKKFLVNGSGRLWHFEIPSAYNTSRSNAARFC
ncbi:hypothetical protein L6164_015088 [Bauhinia variegata]|uniref:Uncharacterized protein n=1 Tax=Bauhinia variegata TaxID=167791 RepID=A0ACB9NKP7_BAUVA|nr:hypothetical protein L6164_015088 [Bauhinia variegata]